MKLGIGLIFAGGYSTAIPTGFFASMYALHSEILSGKTNRQCDDGQQITALELIRSGKFPTDCARNEICQKALDTDCDVLLFLDVDHLFEPDILPKLLNRDKLIVSARYHVKSPPYHPNFYVVPRNGFAVAGRYKAVHYGTGCFEIDRCGAGGLLIRREAIERIGFPWFRYQAAPEPPHDMSTSEDFYFCQRAQEAGITLWGDWDATMDHLYTKPIGPEWYESHLRLMEEEIAAGQTQLVDELVACGFEDGYTLPSGHVVEPYERVAV